MGKWLGNKNGDLWMFTRPGKRLQFAIENGPVVIVDLPSYKMVDISIAMLVYQRVNDG